MGVWNVAIYARVSTDKESQTESIPAQIGSLKKWLLEKAKEDTKNIYKLMDIYEDFGVSGVSSNRNSFIKMKKDIEDKKINMILTRDLSRFSRDYITAGYYLEDYFKVNNIRFISVLDNVDTESEFNDIIPFKNILNEMYIKDCSRRIKSALVERMQRGSSIASKPPYGYRFDEKYEGNIKTISLVSREDETSDVVKEIYFLYLKGWGFGKIANYLNNKSVLPPSVKMERLKKEKLTKWTNSTIKSILTNPKYGGYMVQQRFKKISYKLKTVKITSKEEWVWGKEFQGIIDKNTFKRVQETIEKRKRGYRYKRDKIYIFTSVLKCGACGGGMSYRKDYKGYKCTNSQRGGKLCTSHSIKEEYLKSEIQKIIKNMVEEIIDKNKYYKRIEDIKLEDKIEIELSTIKKELSTVDNKFQRLYEDKLDGNISERNFENLNKMIEQKQENLLRRKLELQTLKEKFIQKPQFTERYKEAINNILNGKCIDREIVQSFIKEIIVNEDKEKMTKKIDIYLKFKTTNNI